MSQPSLIFLPVAYSWFLWVWGGITTTPPRGLSRHAGWHAGWRQGCSRTPPILWVGRAPLTLGPVPSLFQEAFEKLVHHMCSGPSHLLILTRTADTEDVATAWRALMGPCDPHVARREQPDR